MKRFITVVSLGVGLVASSGVASAQQKDIPVIISNGSGTCVTSPSTTTSGVNAGDWTITCGDINPGSGLTVIGPPSVDSVTVSAAGDSGPAPAPAPVAEPAPAEEPAPVEEPAPDTTVDAATADTAVATETDLDADNYPDALEGEIGLDPYNIDTDADGVADGDEINIYSTEPTLTDSDGDGLSDGQELFDSRTDPLVWNDPNAGAGTQTLQQEAASAPVQTVQQKDAVVAPAPGTKEDLTATDGNAAALGPGSASAAPGTVTRDGVSGISLLGPDGTYSVTEVSPPNVSVSGNTGALPPVVYTEPEPVVETVETVESVETVEPVAANTAVVSETGTDLDEDNYPDALEADLGLDPYNIDTDADGVADGDEINIYGTEPTVFDTDGDGLSDGQDLFDSRTDPLVWDSDGDGVGDGEDLNADSAAPVDAASDA
jgi:Bacterial TSP3 repeat